MRNIRNYFDQIVGDTEKKWNALPVKKQKVSTKLFFSLYFLLTLGVLCKIWIDSKNTGLIPSGGHIDKLPRFNNPEKANSETFKISNYDKGK